MLLALKSATEMMERAAVAQTVNQATQGHRKFDWLELGISAATAGFMGSSRGQALANRMQSAFGKATPLINSQLQALSTTAASGNHFDARQVILDNLGQALGNTITTATATAEQSIIMTEPQNHNEPEANTSLDVFAMAAIKQAAITAEQAEGAWNNEEDNLIYGSEFLGFVGSVIYDDSVRPIIGEGALPLNDVKKTLVKPPFAVSFNIESRESILDLSAREIWEIRAHQGTLISNQKVGKVDAIEKLVGFDRSSWNRLSKQNWSLNLDSLQQDILDAHVLYPNVPVDLVNAIIVNESKGAWNAVSGTGALGVMQLTSDNYYKGKGANFNPFDTKKSINYGTKMLDSYIKKYGVTQDGMNKVLVAYNQGDGHLSHIISKHGNNWVKHIHEEGKRYIVSIRRIQNNELNVPGYFGGKK